MESFMIGAVLGSWLAVPIIAARGHSVSREVENAVCLTFIVLLGILVTRVF